MGSFASGLFSVMLSWIRGTVSYLWNMAATPQGGSMIQWLAENWLPLTVILCGIGMVVDAIVHLLRWQPYKVWASFFRRLTGQQQEEETPVRHRPTRLVHRHWVYADGTARTEAVEQPAIPPEEETHPWQDVAPTLSDYILDEEAYRRQFARPETSDRQYSGVTAGLEDYPHPAPMEEELPMADPPAEDLPEGSPAVPRRRRLSRERTKVAFQQLFASHDEDELDLRYKPAQPSVDKAQAYNKPYYPPQWKPPAESGQITKDE